MSSFYFIVSGGYITFAFSGYMIFAAMEQWEWVESNIYDDIIGWLYVTIEANIITRMLVWPIKELMSAFLYLEEESRFTPLNEF